jgi:hypothetical protein
VLGPLIASTAIVPCRFEDRQVNVDGFAKSIAVQSIYELLDSGPSADGRREPRYPASLSCASVRPCAFIHAATARPISSGESS